ncbi:MAG: Protein TolB [Elusimicrobia bacterium]|nr:Protein TolB [Elusimicrobiota bacterium]
MTVQTPHFDIFYDQKSERLVPRMAHHLEAAWAHVGKEYGTPVEGRTPFFFFSNHNEFEQTPIVSIGEGTGGVTEAFKNRFLIFNDGSEKWMKHVIYHEFTHVVQFNILYGGFWKSVQLLKSPFYPLWMMEGTAEYGSNGIDDATGEMVVRDAFANKQLPSLVELQGFNHLKPNQITLGYKTGDAAIKFLKDEYGQDKLKALLVNMKDYFDISSALQATLGEPSLGCDLERFDFRFQEWLHDKYDDFLKEAKTPSFYGPKLTSSDLIPQSNVSPVISPDGKKIYFFSDRGGPDQLYELDLSTLKSKVLLPLKPQKYESLHTGSRALSISPDGRWLAFAGEKVQRDFLYVLDLKKKNLKRFRIPFDQLRSPVFSPINNNQLVCVGMKQGYNDLYLIDRKGHLIKQITDSPQDERDPVFSSDESHVLFSGEVVSPIDGEPQGRNLFSLDLNTLQLEEISDHEGDETEPEPLANGGLLYVRDQDDEGNFRTNLIHRDQNGHETQLTNFIGGGFSPRASGTDHSVFYVGFDAGEKHIYKATWTFEGNSSLAQKNPPPDEKWGEGEARKPQNSQALLNWPLNTTSPHFSNQSRPYRFKGSTDLFIPFFFYSSIDGLVLMDIWQYSDLMGFHQIQQQAQFASGGDTMDLSLAYTYARYRPTFTVGVRSLRFYRDFDEDSQRRELTGIGYVTYPFDRVSSMSLGMGSTNREDVFFDESEPNSDFRDRFLISSLEYNTITGRYLIPTRGNRLAFVFQQGFNGLGGDQIYKTGFVEGTQYVPIPRESTWASRIFLGRSTGADRQVFRLGGIDRVRALSSGSDLNKKSNVALASTELRIRMKYLNARTAFMFPDFFFKAAYLVLFTDVGYGWNNTTERREFETDRLRNSTGLGVSWPTFILQSFQMNLTVQWAKRTDNGSDIWYVSAGPAF